MTDTFDFQSLFKGSSTKELQTQFVGRTFDVPLGTSNLGVGWQKQDGSLLSRTAYATLWEWVQATQTLIDDATWLAEQAAAPMGQVLKYSTGDGSTTFRIPDSGKAVSKTVEILAYDANGYTATFVVPPLVGYIWADFSSVVATALITTITGSVSNTEEVPDYILEASTAVGWRLDSGTNTQGGYVLQTTSTTELSLVATYGSHRLNGIQGNTNYLGNLYIYTGADTPEKAPVVTLEQLLAAAALRNVLYNTDHVNQVVNQRAFHGDWSLINVGVYGYDGWLKYSATHKAQIIELGDFEDRDYLLSYDGVAVKTIRPPDGVATPWLVAVPLGVNKIDLRPSEVKVPYQSEVRAEQLDRCQRVYTLLDYTGTEVLYEWWSGTALMTNTAEYPLPTKLRAKPTVSYVLNTAIQCNNFATLGNFTSVAFSARGTLANNYAYFRITEIVADASLIVADAATNITVVN